MAATGLKYFFDNLLLNNGSVENYFTFASQTGLNVPSESYFTGADAGTLNNATNFYTAAGSGRFDTTKWVDLGHKSLSDWTALFLYERTGVNNHILLSSLEGSGLNVSGFVVGVNESNKLYVSFWNDVENYLSYTFPTIIPSKNIIGVSKNSSQFKINYYDPNARKMEFDTFDIPFNVLKESTHWYLGGSPVFPPQLQATGFDGYIDEFFLMAADLGTVYLEELCSGFLSSPIGPVIDTIDFYCENITGYSGVAVPIFTGITGYETVLVGSVTDSCGFTDNLYSWSGVTGILSGTQLIQIVTSQCYSITGYVDGGYFFDSGLIQSLGMEDLVSLFEIDNQDVFDSFVVTGDIQNLNYNRLTQFNFSNGMFYALSPFGDNEVAVFLNGQLQFEGDFTSFPSGYFLNFNLSGDFFVTGNSFQSTGFYDILDNLVYDIRDSGNSINFSVFSGIESGDTVAFSSQGKSIFYNGQKLFSGVDYSSSGASTTFYKDIESNYFQWAFIPSGLLYNSGQIGYFDTVKFLRNTSQVWLNGIRLNPNTDYLETADLDLLSGQIFLDKVQEQIYNNSDDFFNL